MSNSPQMKKAGEEKSEAKVQFRSDNIGRWASKQENPFAEQNRKTQAKQQKQAEQRKKAAPYVVIIASIVAVAAAVCGLVFLVIALMNALPKPEVEEPPMISGATTEDLDAYRDILSGFYNQRPDASLDERLQDVQNAVNGTLGTESGKKYTNQVLLAQTDLYFNNSLYEQVVEVGKKIDDSSLDNDHKLMYYNLMYYSGAKINETELSNEYLDKFYELSNEMSGEYELDESIE